MVTDNGGIVKGSVTKGLSYLVLADPNSGSTKAQAARKNGTVCISEEAFVAMVTQ
jgi:NAD-dependent DNA ligase